MSKVINSNAEKKTMTVTSTARCAMTLFFIVLFIVATIFFWGIPFAIEGDLGTARFLCDIFGTLYLILAIHRVMEFCNKRITVSTDGITFVNSLGKKTSCSWDNVQIDSYSTRGFKMVFMLNRKRVVIYGYYKNMEEMCVLLADLRKY